MTDNSERSNEHRKVERWLAQMGLAFESEVAFEPYRVDIYLPEWHLAIEVDGPYHHQKHDKARDGYLRDNYGLEILQANFRELGREHSKDVIRKFIVQGAATEEDRRWRVRP